MCRTDAEKCIVPIRFPPLRWPTLSSSATEDCVNTRQPLPCSQSLPHPCLSSDQRNAEIELVNAKALCVGNATALLPSSTRWAIKGSNSDTVEWAQGKPLAPQPLARSRLPPRPSMVCLSGTEQRSPGQTPNAKIYAHACHAAPTTDRAVQV